jgi:hypothetical protein
MLDVKLEEQDLKLHKELDVKLREKGDVKLHGEEDVKLQDLVRIKNTRILISDLDSDRHVLSDFCRFNPSSEPSYIGRLVVSRDTQASCSLSLSLSHSILFL